MLEVQKYLRSGKTLEDLKNELDIKSNCKDGLVCLNYSQCGSPKLHPIVMECRGLILEEGTWDVVCKGFNRFFNWGEAEELTKNFDFGSSVALQKIDGSYISCFFYKGTWKMATRGTIEGTGSAGIGLQMTFRELFDKIVEQYPDFWKKLHTDYTYIFELVSPENKVVKLYPYRALYLLGIRQFFGGCWTELPYDSIRIQAEYLGVRHPSVVTFTDVAGLIKTANQLKDLDEGFVVVNYQDLFEGDFQRVKIKSKDYLAMARLKESGGKSVRTLMDLIIRCKDEEFVKQFPEFLPIIRPLRAAFDKYLEMLTPYINEAFAKRGIPRKDFAKWALSTPNSTLMFGVYDKRVLGFRDMVEKMSEEKGSKPAGRYVLEKCLGITSLDIDKAFEET